MRLYKTGVEGCSKRLAPPTFGVGVSGDIGISRRWVEGGGVSGLAISFGMGFSSLESGV